MALMGCENLLGIGGWCNRHLHSLAFTGSGALAHIRPKACRPIPIPKGFSSPAHRSGVPQPASYEGFA